MTTRRISLSLTLALTLMATAACTHTSTFAGNMGYGAADSVPAEVVEKQHVPGRRADHVLVVERHDLDEVGETSVTEADYHRSSLGDIVFVEP